MRINQKRRRCAAFVLLTSTGLLSTTALLTPSQAWAIGEVTGRIGGVVQVEGTKDGLAGVELVVRSKQLIGGSQKATTADDGSYVFQNLPPGVYELTTRIEGFSPIEQRGIVVNAGQLAPVDISLRVGLLTETTKIIEKRNPVLNTESAVSTTTFDNTKVFVWKKGFIKVSENPVLKETNEYNYDNQSKKFVNSALSLSGTPD